MDHRGGRWLGRPDGPGRTKAAVLRLAVRQDVVAGALHPLVARVGSELLEEDHLPDRAPVLGRIARALASARTASGSCAARIAAMGSAAIAARAAATTSGSSAGRSSSWRRARCRTAGSLGSQQPVERVCPQGRCQPAVRRLPHGGRPEVDRILAHGHRLAAVLRDVPDPQRSPLGAATRRTTGSRRTGPSSPCRSCGQHRNDRPATLSLRSSRAIRNCASKTLASPVTRPGFSRAAPHAGRSTKISGRKSVAVRRPGDGLVQDDLLGRERP